MMSNVVMKLNKEIKGKKVYGKCLEPLFSSPHGYDLVSSEPNGSSG